MQDEEEFENASAKYSKQLAKWEKFKNLARRILSAELKAFTQTLVEVNPFADISDLGSAIHFTVHMTKLVERRVKVKCK